MSVKVNKLNVSISPYIIQLGYIRRLRAKPLDVWSYKTHEVDYLLSLPSHMLHKHPLNVSSHRFDIGKLAVHIGAIDRLHLHAKVRQRSMLKVRMGKWRYLIPRFIIKKQRVQLSTVVRTVLGFYGVPIKRRGIEANKVPSQVKSAFRVLLLRKKIRKSLKLRYYFPNVAIAPSGKIKYLGGGYLLVIPSRGTRLMLNVYIASDKSGREYVLMEVVQ